MSGQLNETDIKQLLQIVKPHLDTLEVEYWLGRGVLRQVFLTGHVGDKQSDLDIHIWTEDREKVRQKVGPVLTKLGFNENNNESYKLAYTNDDNGRIVEFMLLFRDGDVVYHTRRNGVRLECPKRCFETTNEKIEVAGILIPAPAFTVEYIGNVYGHK